MIRFECIHCGGRIAVQDRHMDRLSRCPDCGGITHPLAEHLVEPKNRGPRFGAATSTLTPATQVTRVSISAAHKAASCDNCGQTIGKLQKPRRWENHVVCDPCLRTLKSEKMESLATTLAPATSAITLKSSAEATEPLSAPSPVVVVEAVRPMTRPSEYSITLPGACIGVCALALAIYLIVTILQSLGVLIIWSAMIIAAIAGAYWVRRGVLGIRRKFSWLQPERQSRQVRAVVRESGA